MNYDGEIRTFPAYSLISRMTEDFVAALHIVRRGSSGPIFWLLLLILGCMALPFASSVSAQNADTGALSAPVRPLYFGVGATAGLNIYSMNVPVYSGSTYCGTFTSGTGIRPNIFVASEFPLQSNSDWNGFWLFPRIHLNFLGASIANPAVDNGDARAPDSSLVPSTRENRLAASIAELGADLFASYQFTPMFKALGTLFSATSTQTEVLTAPANAVFTDTHTNTRTLQSGDIPNKSGFFAALTLGAGMNIPLGTYSRLTPELTFSYPLTSVRSNFKWDVMALRLGTGIEFNTARPPRVVPPVIPAVLPPPHSLAATVKIVGMMENENGDETGTEMDVPSIKIEEFVRREAYPMLNFIFFDEGSADIPQRYYLFGDKLGTASFDLNSLAGQKTLTVYYHTLNIIGKRMELNKAATLTLIGSNENVGVEQNAVRLSQARADAIKKYLVTVWEIDPKRIMTQATNLPRVPSPSDTKVGQEENRRVEIVSNDPEILDPIGTQHIDRTMNPPILRVRTTIKSTSPTVATLDLEQQGKVIEDFGDAKPAQEWKPEPKELPSAEQPIVAALHVKNDEGDSITVRDSTIVHQITIQKKREEKVNDKIVERYSLITFDFDQSELDTRSKRVIADIAKNVTPKDSIHVTGYTDMTGEANHNKTLSSDRANNVLAALRNETKAKASTATIFAAGEGQKDLVDNQLPEGRFLSRTVNIRIERPISAE